MSADWIPPLNRKQIAGKHQATQIKHLSKNNFIITDKKNIAD